MELYVAHSIPPNGRRVCLCREIEPGHRHSQARAGYGYMGAERAAGANPFPLGGRED